MKVLEYFLLNFFNIVFIIGFTLIIACFTGHVQESVIALIAFAALRQVSGGYHLNSGWLCIFASVLLMTVLSLVSLEPIAMNVLSLVSFLLCLVFSPSNIAKQTRIPQKYFPLLKVISLLIIVSSYLIGSAVLTASLFAQSLTIIRTRR
ncbi:accessory gene regulator B family protein [Paenibacillus silvisoli]|uniref:accessory gene regulator B family protein n=1 Tax=Paenibacillus silvisoli TaxID=3110539 RepID=UPI002806340A|nr:accessory gene regulator B family protein [Paenibacillus silvisoli]